MEALLTACNDNNCIEAVSRPTRNSKSSPLSHVRSKRIGTFPTSGKEMDMYKCRKKISSIDSVLRRANTDMKIQVIKIRCSRIVEEKNIQDIYMLEYSSG